MSFEKHVSGNQSRGVSAAITGLLMVASTSVFAHHPMGGTTPQTLSQGLLSGLGHPVIGLDHLAFLVAAILLTSLLNGVARFVVPLVFIGATVAGTVLHLGAANIPLSETLVALTVLIGGALAMTRRNTGALALGALFAVSGIFHGYAYGEAIVGAEATPLLAYLAGFAVIQYALIVGGVLGLDKIGRHSENARLIAARSGSAAALMTGGLFLALSIA